MPLPLGSTAHFAAAAVRAAVTLRSAASTLAWAACSWAMLYALILLAACDVWFMSAKILVSALLGARLTGLVASR